LLLLSLLPLRVLNHPTEEVGKLARLRVRAEALLLGEGHLLELRAALLLWRNPLKLKRTRALPTLNARLRC
jgi:hypothetical protein